MACFGNLPILPYKGHRTNELQSWAILREMVNLLRVKANGGWLIDNGFTLLNTH